MAKHTDGPATLSDLLAECRAAFQSADESAELCDPALEARMLVAGLFDLSATDMISNGQQVMDEPATIRLRQAIARRIAGEPVHRILGFREFYGLTFALSPDTLEPRPDTETLVDQVLPHLRSVIAQKGAARVLDLGTGTGAICQSLLQECPQASGVGTDISTGALETAAANARQNGLGDRFEALESNWFSHVVGRFDLIVSNPPYIPSGDIAGLSVAVRDHDPLRALDGGPDGLEPYRVIAANAAEFLEPGGVVAVEIGWDQRKDVDVIFGQAGFSTIRAVKDFGGNDRVMVFAPSIS
jgi:release factor glutamine methyltransferase